MGKKIERKDLYLNARGHLHQTFKKLHMEILTIVKRSEWKLKPSNELFVKYDNIIFTNAAVSKPDIKMKTMSTTLR